MGYILVMALAVALLALSVVSLCCRMVYLNSIKNGINPYPWVLFELLATPALGSIIYVIYCCSNGYRLYFKELKKYLIILVVVISLLVINCITLAIVCFSAYM